MIESAAYDIIKKEGYEEGVKAGIQQGIQQGILFAIKSILELRFGAEGLKIYPEIKKINDPDMLESIADAIKIAKNIEEIKELY